MHASYCIGLVLAMSGWAKQIARVMTERHTGNLDGTFAPCVSEGVQSRMHCALSLSL